MSAKAAQVIRRLFEVFYEDTRLLPPEAQDSVQFLEQRDGFQHGRARAVADYIAGMTDRYAIAEYERLFNPSQLTLTSG